MAQLPQWEYQIVVIPRVVEDAVDYLNTEGLLGWEFAWLYDTTHVVMKRELSKTEVDQRLSMR